jgi:transposase-like protein
MPRRRTTLQLTLTPEEQAHLLKLTRATTQGAPYLAQRAEMVLLVAEGRLSISAIARQCHVTWKAIPYWVERFQAHGIEGLQTRPYADRRRTGLRVTLTPEEEANLRKLTQTTAYASAALAKRAAIILLMAEGRYSVTTISRRCQIWRRHVYKWIARFQEARLAGLRAKPHHGGGRPKKQVT